MTEAIAALNKVLGKILAYGPSRKDNEQRKKPVKKVKTRKKQRAPAR